MTEQTDIWRKAVVSPGATMQEAIDSLEQFGLRIVLVADGDGRLLGTVSDGDIRRELLKGRDLKRPVSDFMHDTPLVVPPGMGRELVLHLMTANHIQQIPIVDESRRLLGLHLWTEIAEAPARGNVVVVMAGGKGTRLRPHTENCPKPMLPVAGRPILEHIVERAKQGGFNRFVFAVHYLGHMIEEHFGSGAEFGVEIEYLREDAPLGTAGGLQLLSPRPDKPFIVTNGDLLTDIRYSDLLEFHQRHDAAATMAVHIHEWQHAFGVVHTTGVDIVGFEEKPITRTHINAGVYALSPEALDVLKPGEVCDMPTLFERLQAKGKRIVAYPMHEPWLDVGRPADLETAKSRLSETGE